MNRQRLAARITAKDERPFWINMGLLYPGISGAVLYEAGPHLFSWPWTWAAPQLLLFVMLLNFTLDYAYSVDEKSRSDYSWWKIPFDFAIVWLLYAALKSVETADLDLSKVVRVGWLLAVTKVLALCWEAFGGRHRDATAKSIALVTDGVLCGGFFILAFLGSSGALVPDGVIWLLIVAVAVDAVLYLGYEWIYRQCTRDPHAA
jgi:hypothetical protein